MWEVVAQSGRQVECGSRENFDDGADLPEVGVEPTQSSASAQQPPPLLVSRQREVEENCWQLLAQALG